MDGRSFGNADNPGSIQEIGQETLGKRKKIPTPKARTDTSETTEPKKPQMVRSDPLLIFIAQMIEGDPDTWGVLLTRKHGKNRVADGFIEFLSSRTNPLTNGKTFTTETISKWIKYGMERAEAETQRRATAATSGRNEQPPEIDKAWFNLMEFWTEYLKDKPATSRYNTPPSCGQGSLAV
jgi:hypothetical protein